MRYLIKKTVKFSCLKLFSEDPIELRKKLFGACTAMSVVDMQQGNSWHIIRCGGCQNGSLITYPNSKTEVKNASHAIETQRITLIPNGLRQKLRKNTW